MLFGFALVGLAISCSESAGYVVASSEDTPTEVAATATAIPPTPVPSPTPEPPPPSPTAEPPPIVVAPAPVSQPARVLEPAVQPAPAVRSAPPPPPPPVARGPATINLVGKNLLYSQTSFSVASGATVTVNLDNQDTAVAHDVGVNLAGVGHSATCSGPCRGSITFTAPSPGRYEFFCSLHMDMKGTFTVSP
jgi:plastocyanin